MFARDSFARAYGFRNIQNVVRRLKNGKSHYHFVELMACPGGCANGGGQPRPSPQEAIGRAARVEVSAHALQIHIPFIIEQHEQAIYQEETHVLLSQVAFVEPSECVLSSPQDNPRVISLFASGGFLEGGPLGTAAQQHLLTQYHVRELTEADPLAIKW